MRISPILCQFQIHTLDLITFADNLKLERKIVFSTAIMEMNTVNAFFLCQTDKKHAVIVGI